MSIKKLVDSGVIRIASLPPANWQDVENTEFLIMPLIAEDYPAKTAVMWNSAYEKLGMQNRNTMVVSEPKDVEHIIQSLRSDDKYRGGGAGVGFKEIVIPFLDEVTPIAKAMGAVNIIKKDSLGRLIGDNTDGEGYALGLEQILGKSLKGANVLLLGAGGSGRAIAFALVKKGANLIILNRTESKAEELASSINEHFGFIGATGGGRELIDEVLPFQDAVVSVIDDARSPLDDYSTLGSMKLPITQDSLLENEVTAQKLLKKAKPSLIVSDIRIRKGPTAMLAQAEALGFRTLDGIPMVVHQGIAAFTWLHGDILDTKGVSVEEINNIMWQAVSSK